MKRYDPAAIRIFLDEVFLRGSFNLWWWFFVAGILWAWLKSKSQEFAILALYGLALFCGLFYFGCFTGNVTLTLRGINVGRLLLQISGLLLPLAVFLLRDLEGVLKTKPGNQGSGRMAP
jgi:hypothetical protein